jgi:magnesium-transporting ATPase (P-type)
MHLLALVIVLCDVAYNPFGSYGGGTPYVGNLDLAVVIIFVIAFSAFFNTYQEYQADRVLEAFRAGMTGHTYVDGTRLHMRANRSPSVHHRHSR